MWFVIHAKKADFRTEPEKHSNCAKKSQRQPLLFLSVRGHNVPPPDHSHASPSEKGRSRVGFGQRFVDERRRKVGDLKLQFPDVMQIKMPIRKYEVSERFTVLGKAPHVIAI
jgi:hypothetical protein